MKSRGSACSWRKQKVSPPQSTACMSSVSIVTHTTLRVAALWPRFLEACVNIDSLTVCYHHCALVVRLFGLRDQNPGSVNTSRDSKVEIQWRNQANLDHCIWQTKKHLSRSWENFCKIPEAIFHPCSPLWHIHTPSFSANSGRKTLTNILDLLLLVKEVFFSRTAVFLGTVQYLHPPCNKKPVFCHLLYGELLGFEKKWWKHDQGLCDFKSY